MEMLKCAIKVTKLDVADKITPGEMAISHAQAMRINLHLNQSLQ